MELAVLQSSGNFRLYYCNICCAANMLRTFTGSLNGDIHTKIALCNNENSNYAVQVLLNLGQSPCVVCVWGITRRRYVEGKWDFLDIVFIYGCGRLLEQLNKYGLLREGRVPWKYSDGWLFDHLKHEIYANYHYLAET